MLNILKRVEYFSQLTFKDAFKKEIRFVLCVWNNRKPIVAGTPISSVRTTPRRSLDKSLDRTPKSSRRVVIGRSSEEMREMAQGSGSSSGSNNAGRGEKEARV